MTIQEIKDKVAIELNAIGLDFERVNENVINQALNTSFRRFANDIKNILGVITVEKATKIFGGDLITITTLPTQIDLSTFIDIYETNTSTRVRSGESIIDRKIYHPYDAFYNITDADGNTLSINIAVGELANVVLVHFITSDFASSDASYVPDATANAIIYLTCFEITKMPETGLEQFAQNYFNLYTQALANATRI